MAHSFHVKTEHEHLKWNRDIPPAMTVPSGSEISFDLKDGGNNQIRPDNAATAYSTFDLSLADPAFGPVFVEGAEPGDVLRVDILECTPADYGWTAILPGFGLLADEFPDPHVKIWDLSPAATVPGPSSSSSSPPRRRRRPRAVFKPGITVPLRPFLGVIGVAPASPGEFSTIPPYARSGGNMDTRYLGPGTTLYMPVQAAGALFSCGDGHAAQGDGEVCGTAIETPMRARVRLSVEKKAERPRGWTPETPHYVTGPRAAAAGSGQEEEEEEEEGEEDGGVYAALGFHADPREAARMALRGLIDWLEAVKGLTRVEGYMLASVAASLKMTEVVDMPNYGVSCSIPLSTFSD